MKARRHTKRSFIIRQVRGNSMLPALKHGQVVLARSTYELRPGDVVIAQHNGLEKVKRVAELREGEVYLLGDNPGASTDSRNFGWVPVKSIVAKIVWPKR